MARRILQTGLLALALGAPLSVNFPKSTPSAPPADERVIDLNTATLDELLSFKGIGRLYAEKILKARPFASRSDLVKRNVLPPTVYLAIKHRLFVTQTGGGDESRALDPVPVGMLDLNQATRQELLRTPGIGLRYADQIIEGRPYRTEYELVSRRILPLTIFNNVQSFIAVER